MKKYNLSPPENNVWCVPSCLQAVLRYGGQEMSQKKIYNKLTKMENGFVLINDNKIEKFFEKRGFMYNSYFYNETPFNEPDGLLEKMSEEKNHGILGINNHVYLLIEFSDPDLMLLEPKKRVMIKRDLIDLNTWMHENSIGVFGLVKKV